MSRDKLISQGGGRLPQLGAVLGRHCGPPASAITLAGAQKPAAAVFWFTFTNTPGAFFSVLATTNPALPSRVWMTLGDAAEGSRGHFQFTDM